jgi:hypothetical protein
MQWLSNPEPSHKVASRPWKANHLFACVSRCLGIEVKCLWFSMACQCSFIVCVCGCLVFLPFASPNSCQRIQGIRPLARERQYCIYTAKLTYQRWIHSNSTIGNRQYRKLAYQRWIRKRDSTIGSRQYCNLTYQRWIHSNSSDSRE